MIVQSIHFIFAAEDGAKAEALLRELRDASRNEPGVIGFDVGRSPEHPQIFALWEQYADQAAVDAHLASDHYNRLVANALRSLVKSRDIATVIPI